MKSFRLYGKFNWGVIMAYVWTEIDYKLKAIAPNYIPIEERSHAEQEKAYDRIFDGDEEDDG